MNQIEKYSRRELKQEISEIENSLRYFEFSKLDLCEKALIYKYSADGYELVNEQLRRSKGKTLNEFGKLLGNVLRKLPNYDGIVYRGVTLTEVEFKRYHDAFVANKLIKEYAFVSTSTSRLIAMESLGNVLFRILSRTGKEIEKIAKFGQHGEYNEKEVLFIANRNFRIIAITKESLYSLITMEEV